jgi:excinuclease UvrABC nuclease subunit
VARLTREMREAAANLDFERAAALRDRIRALKDPTGVLAGARGG